MDRIRVLRLVEYVGDRDEIESLVERSLHGKRHLNSGYIQATTLGEVSEIMKVTQGKKEEE